MTEPDYRPIITRLPAALEAEAQAEDDAEKLAEAERIRAEVEAATPDKPSPDVRP